MNEDRFNLARFTEAQAAVHETALLELRRCRKQSHWMWFVFPQVDGLGSSPTSRLYSIRSKAEAEAYVNHPVLGPRLASCFEAVLQCQGKSALDILGQPDDAKLRSSATLFAAVSEPNSVFHRVLERFFEGKPDHRTIDLLERPPASR